MPSEGQQEDRTEAATPRRLQKAREEGRVPVSRELTSLAGMAAVTLVLIASTPTLAQDLARQLSVFLLRAHDMPSDVALRRATLAWLGSAAPVVLAAMAAGVAAVLLQTRFLLSGKALRVDVSRLSPRAGMKRLLGLDNLVEAGKSIVKVSVLSAILWRVLVADLPRLMQAPYGAINQLLIRIVDPVLHILWVALAAQAIIAATDYSWVCLRHARGLRMSRHDIMEEQKEVEVDPRVKARLRQIRNFRARKRMLAAVPMATVVVINPTHYAVALAYDRLKSAAPRVVAKGVDALAARIRDVAEAHGVPLVVNPPLARALFRVEVDADIPPEHYQTIAEIIAYVWRLKGKSAYREQSG